MLKILSKWNRWGSATLAAGIQRHITAQLIPQLNEKDIVVLVGPRRAGKTTVLFQLMDILQKQQVPVEAILHVNFEEPALAPLLKLELLDNIYQIYRAHIYPEGRAFLFLDEIQNIPQWEKWVRARNETEDIKIFITGSSSQLMSRELSTLLTGRHLTFKVFPLSFNEYLHFKDISLPTSKVPIASPKILHALENYLQWGGFPEVVLAKDEQRRALLLKQYFDDILFKDVVIRHQIRDAVTLRNLAVFLLTQTASLISFQRLAQLFGVSVELAKMYCHYLQEAFLVDFLPFFSLKVSERNRNPQKVHAIDLGLRQIANLSHSTDEGRIMETAVFNVLNRQNHDGIFYWKQRGEIDLAIRSGNAIITLVQVARHINDPNTEKRECTALLDAGTTFPKAKKYLIINEDSNPQLKINTIDIVPLWQYLLAADIR